MKAIKIHNSILQDSSLSREMKLIYLFLWLKADRSGVVVWSDTMKYQLEDFAGIQLPMWPERYLYSLTKEKIEIVGNQWIIKGYISANYGKELIKTYSPHIPVFRLLDAHGLEYSLETNTIVKKKTQTSQ